MNARVLVLGANGFIGCRVVAQLVGEGGTVIAASRRPPVTQAHGVEYLTLDAVNEPALCRAIDGVSGIINCIAGDPETIVSSATALFSAVARTAARPRVVHMSSLAAYGSIEGDVDESVVPRGDLGPYSAAKLMTEKLAARCESSVTLRPGIVYGAGSPWWSDRIARLLCAHRLGDLGDAGGGLCNLVHVDDVATAAVRAVRRPGIEGRTFNLGSPSVPTWNDYFAAYAQALRALPIRRITARRLAQEKILLAPALKLLELAVRGPLKGMHPPPALRPWLLILCKHRIGMLVKRAEIDLGMQWKPLRDGLEHTAAWFRSGGRTS